MPGKKTHQCVGAAAGVALAAFEAKDQPNPYFWIETIGGALGGVAGGMLPDWLEPAFCSWHRGVCHSATAGVAVLFKVKGTLADWAEICRKEADRCRIVPQVQDAQTGQWIPIPRPPLEQLWAEIREFIWRLLGWIPKWFDGGLRVAFSA